jgi:hypothetical protein
VRALADCGARPRATIPPVLTILLFRPDTARPTGLDEIAEHLAAVPGVELSGVAEDRYRPGGWRDAATGARCLIDLGDAPLEEDTLHPPRAYAGWLPAGVSVQVPLAGPHWFCVEALRLVEALLADFPDWRALDVEDVVEGDGARPGPFAWDRPRAIANWERQRANQLETLGNVPRMHRRASIAHWRYRRERARGRERHPGHAWPDGAALLELASGTARSAALWLDPTKPFALPPVELLVLRAGQPRVVSADQAATLCGGGEADPSGTRLVEPGPAVERFIAEAEAQPATAYRALGDEDWAD